MFAVDTMLPINMLFILFIMLCLCACVVGIIETQGQDPADSEIPAAFRTMRNLANIPDRATPPAKNGARRDGANGAQPQRPRTK